MRDAPHRLVELGNLELISSGPYEAVGLAGGSWPCPGCGEVRALTGARSVVVRNRQSPRMERTIVLCADCVAALA